MKKYYYDPTKYKTYLEQLGIKYPTVRRSHVVHEIGADQMCADWTDRPMRHVCVRP